VPFEKQIIRNPTRIIGVTTFIPPRGGNSSRMGVPEPEPYSTWPSRRQPGHYTRSGVTSGWAVIRQELENPNAYNAQ
jgi:hypothetical protein